MQYHSTNILQVKSGKPHRACSGANFAQLSFFVDRHETIVPFHILFVYGMRRRCSMLGMSNYVSGGSSFPKPLSAEEEALYLEKYAQGDESARNILIERNLRLVAHIAKKYVSSAVSNDDLISIGTIGLIKAVSTFNRDKGSRLGTYAVRCIENEILMYIRLGKKYQGEVSLHEPVGMDREGNEIALMDLLSSDDESFLDELDAEIRAKRLYRAIGDVLNQRERFIVELRYGLLNGVEMTQKEVGKLLDISRSYVSRIEKKALEKLQKCFDGPD